MQSDSTITQDLSRSRRRTPCYFFFQAEDGIRYLTVTGVQTCALPICFGDPREHFLLELEVLGRGFHDQIGLCRGGIQIGGHGEPAQRFVALLGAAPALDRKSTRLNSSHSQISYAVFCLKKKTKFVRT